MIKDIFKGQVWNYILLIVFLVLIDKIVGADEIYIEGSLFGIGTEVWFYITLLVPILHQFYVWLCWRLELHRNTLSKGLGEKAFNYYKVGFSVLILSRPVSILFLSVSNSGTLDLPTSLSVTLGIILLIPALYLGYSLKKFFGFDRAYGIDHFKPEEAKTWPMVNKGIFKYSANSMYVFGFLMLYSLALFADSKSGLLLAFFNHLYIWVHFFFTEKSDMKAIYGSPSQK
jgi:protein-S-isoprenylcysteine O-methyltransferase Ste14